MKKILLQACILFLFLCASIVTEATIIKNTNRIHEPEDTNFVQSRYPQIIYWKWDDTILEGTNLEDKTHDLLKRSNFDLIYISFHWVDKPFLTKELVGKIEKCAAIIHEAGRKIMLDIDSRNEEEFEVKYPGHKAYLGKLLELTLDENGNGNIEVPPLKASHWANNSISAVEYVVNAWTFKTAAQNQFVNNSLQNIKKYTTVKKSADSTATIIVKAGKANANKKALLIPAIPHVLHDFYSPKLYEFWASMFEGIKHIPIDGVAIDEWGPDMVVTKLEKNITKDNWEVSFKNENFPYSRFMNKAYQEKYGNSLEEDLLYLRYAGAGEEGKRIRIINNYIENLRSKISENEAWFYDKGKQTFGPQTFIGAHTTWWCDSTNSFFDTFKNGFNWWEIKRDYGQTDEEVIIPIRLSHAHKWGGNVWYNMWTMTNRRVSPPIVRYHTETWRNARYGGRSHHLGYESGKEGFPAMKEAGVLEAVSAMEDRIKVLNGFQKSQPDSRVLVLFGMEAVTNWQLSDPDRTTWYRQGTNMHQTMKMARKLFEAGYLCDMVPTSEIVNGSLLLKNNKLVYGTQTYDAVVFMFPDGIEKKVMEKMNAYKRGNQNLMVIGTCQYYRDGTNAKADFNEFVKNVAYSPQVIGEQAVLKKLAQWKVDKNTVDKGCIYQDGSVIFTADAEKNIGNSLQINTTIKGHRVAFSGEDFLAIDLDENGKVNRYAAGAIDYLKVDGKNVVNSPTSGR